MKKLVITFIIGFSFFASIDNLSALETNGNMQLTKEEYIDAEKFLTQSPLKYNKSLTKKKIYDFKKQSIISGKYNISGYVIAKSECLSPCEADSVCIELCVQGIIISNEKTNKKLSHTGHDINDQKEMIIFFYSRGRDLQSDLDKIKIGKKYDFSITKNPYQAEIIGYR